MNGKVETDSASVDPHEELPVGVNSPMQDTADLCQIFSRFEAFNFDDDHTFQAGLANITGHACAEKGTEQSVDLLKIKLFYYSKHVEPLDMAAYAKWKKTTQESEPRLTGSRGSRKKDEGNDDAPNSGEMVTLHTADNGQSDHTTEKGDAIRGAENRGDNDSEEDKKEVITYNIAGTLTDKTVNKMTADIAGKIADEMTREILTEMAKERAGKKRGSDIAENAPENAASESSVADTDSHRRHNEQPALRCQPCEAGDDYTDDVTQVTVGRDNTEKGTGVKADTQFDFGLHDKKGEGKWLSGQGSSGQENGQGSSEQGGRELSFAEVAELIQRGAPVPGLTHLDVLATEEAPSPSLLIRPKKPWEL